MASSASLASQAEPTISDIEQIVQAGLEALRDAPLNDQIAAALKFLIPPGYRPIAQLEEDGRKKRNTAAASNWNPETGEILIYFERLQPDSQAVTQPVRQVDEARYIPKHTKAVIDALSLSKQKELIESNDPDYAESCEYQFPENQIKQCCEALAEAEKAGKGFIALKWFRDVRVAALDYPWAVTSGMRQAVLARAIEYGAILTSQIPNPKSPQHPTTTIKLNRESKYAQAVASRFQPIQLRGEGPTASEIVLRDRGRL